MIDKETACKFYFASGFGIIDVYKITCYANIKYIILTKKEDSSDDKSTS